MNADRFWNGEFPGYGFESVPDTYIRAQMEAYHNGLQRYMALTGCTWRECDDRHPFWEVRLWRWCLAAVKDAWTNVIYWL